MPRVFLFNEIESSTFITLSKEETFHLRVIKSKRGDIVNLIDGSGYRFRARVVEIKKTFAKLEIISKDLLLKSPGICINLAQAISRFNRFEFILQKATELGVNGIFPLITERSFLSVGKSLNENRWKRWNKIVLEASKQSGRLDFPGLLSPQSIDIFLGNCKDFELKLCLWEEEENENNLRDMLRVFSKPKTVCILVGPEGGFSKGEAEKIKQADFKTLLCGPRIMRAETAALAFISICQYEWGDF